MATLIIVIWSLTFLSFRLVKLTFVSRFSFCFHRQLPILKKFHRNSKGYDSVWFCRQIIGKQASCAFVCVSDVTWTLLSFLSRFFHPQTNLTSVHFVSWSASKTDFVIKHQNKSYGMYQNKYSISFPLTVNYTRIIIAFFAACNEPIC